MFFAYLVCANCIAIRTNSSVTFSQLIDCAMLSVSQGSNSVTSLSNNPRYRKPRPVSVDSSSFGKLRAANIASNEQMLKDLGLEPKSKEQKLPVFSKRVVATPKKVAQLERTQRGIDRCDEDSQSSTKYPCVRGCKSVYKKVTSFVAHLKRVHELSWDTEHLAPLGLGLCPYCNGVFAASRGMANHIKSCNYTPALLSELVEGPFPRKCRVWWQFYKTWYEGLASPSREYKGCWEVSYPNGDVETEFFHVVVFDPLPVDEYSEISLPLDSSDGWESVCLSPIPRRRSNKSNVLAACDVSDSDASPGFPTCSPVARLPVTPIPLAVIESLPSTQVASDNCLDYKHVETTLDKDTNARMHIDNCLDYAHVETTLDKDTNARMHIDNCLDYTHVETTLDKDIDARMHIDSTLPEPNYCHASLEIRDCKQSRDDVKTKELNDILPDWALEGSAIPLNFEPTKTNVTQVLIDIQRKAGFLKGFPPLAMWRAAQKRKWEHATADFMPYFEMALTFNRDSAEFLIMCLRVLELPSLALKFTLPEQKGISEGKAALSNKLRKVESLTMQNRLHAASKVLFSHGIAPASEELFERLQKLHPPLKEPIPDLGTGVKQFSISPVNTAQNLFKSCTEHWSTPDPYGWNTAMLHLIRNVDDFPGRSFFFCYSTLVSHVVSAEVSDLVAYSLSSGSIIGLNKDDEETQNARREKGLSPRERPINQGSLILKLAFDLALHSPAAQAATKELEPIQQGVGAKRGMEVIAHVCNALYSEGYAILKMDATNGFQEIKRSSLHRAVWGHCPSLLSLFKKYYTKESTCFFNLESEVRLLCAGEGARIGCKLSSFAFALTVKDLYARIRSSASRAGGGSCIKAAIDDIVVALKPAPEDEKLLYYHVNEICTILDKESPKVGLSFSNDKAQILLPKNWIPKPELLPPGILILSNTAEDPKLRGMEIVGAPVGAPEFCSTFVSKTLTRMLQESESLVNLHPQCATKLLKDCVCAAPAYLAQVCHPSITKQHLTYFDDRVWELWLQILGGVGGEGPGVCNLSVDRSRMKAFLPSRFNGVGLRSWERTADFAWFASVASCTALQDDDFNYARQLFKSQGESAYTIALEAVGGPSYLERSDYEVLPAGEPDVLSNSTFYIDLFKETPKLRLQKAMLDLANLVAHDKFVNYDHHSDLSENILRESMKRPNVSLLSRMFTVNLMHTDVRVTKPEFTSVARQFVCLPPLANGSTGPIVELKCGCGVQKCTNPKCKATSDRLDFAGNHGLVCNPGVKAMRASLMEKALEVSFRRAGGNPVRQPSTYSLLGEIFSKDDLSKLFFGRVSARKNRTSASSLPLNI